MKATLAVLPGDGIGPEITREACRVLDAIANRCGHQFAYATHRIGGAAIDADNDPYPAATEQACKDADAVLLGAVGGPKWDGPSAKLRPEQGLLRLRKSLRVFANLRPVRVFPCLMGASPLRPEALTGVDMLVVRELTGGIYFGEPRRRETLADGSVKATDTLVYTDEEIRRVVDLAFRLAKGRRGLVTSVDKANVLESSRLWREVTEKVHGLYADVRLEHQLVDSAAMRLITAAASFDVLVMENMFGDILSDEAAVLAGSLGVLPSASIGDGSQGLYEPIHGSAPNIAGQGIANPIGTILSAALLLRHSLKLHEEAMLIEQAVERALEAGARTADLAGGINALTTHQMGTHVIEQLSSQKR